MNEADQKCFESLMLDKFGYLPSSNQYEADEKIFRAALSHARGKQEPVAAENDDEIYEIGVREGYERAVQEIDIQTGGDGEYRFCTDRDPDRHTPDAPTMIRRIVDRFLSPAESEEVARLREENERLKEALTPSGDTKAEYSGEFHIQIQELIDPEDVDEDEDGEEYRTVAVLVPWTTIKQIMAAISARAASRGHGHD